MKRLKFLVVLVGVLVAMFLLNKYNVFSGFTPVDIRDYILGFGIYAPIIYVLLFTFVPLTFFPDSFLAIAGGMVFGLVGGFIATMIGALCGSTLAFYLARLLRSDFLRSYFSKKGKVSESKLEKNGFMVVLILRLIPLFPMDVISYSAGFAKVKYRDFILATALGTIPGIFVFTNIGDKSLEVGSHSFYGSIALLVLLFSLSFFLKKKLSLKEIKQES